MTSDETSAAFWDEAKKAREAFAITGRTIQFALGTASIDSSPEVTYARIYVLGEKFRPLEGLLVGHRDASTPLLESELREGVREVTRRELARLRG